MAASGSSSTLPPDAKLLKQGAEARIYACTFLGKRTIIKERFKKCYRNPVLDKSLTTHRIRSEVRSMARCRINGIRTPVIYFVDMEESKIYMEHVADSTTVKDYISRFSVITASLLSLSEKIGERIGTMHGSGIIHGDLTTSNMLLSGNPDELDLVFIDFGLGYVEASTEDKAVDLYVLERALLSTHPSTEPLFDAMLGAYARAQPKESSEVVKKLNEVRLRGRKRTMVG